MSEALKKPLPGDAEAKASILDVGRRMYDKNYCAANDGNISCRTADGNLWITPSGVSKGFMSEDILIKVDMDGNELENRGGMHASSELQLHLNVYRERPDVGAVVHAHPPVATAFACARKDLDIPVVTEALLNLGTVPCAPFATPGSPELAETIIPYVKGHAALLMASHGTLTWGQDMIQAYYRLETLEYYANMLVITGHVPEPHILTPEEVKAVEERRKGYGIVL